MVVVCQLDHVSLHVHGEEFISDLGINRFFHRKHDNFLRNFDCSVCRNDHNKSHQLLLFFCFHLIRLVCKKRSFSFKKLSQNTTNYYANSLDSGNNGFNGPEADLRNSKNSAKLRFGLTSRVSNPTDATRRSDFNLVTSHTNFASNVFHKFTKNWRLFRTLNRYVRWDN